ncbi:cilia- and flagella-associated protein 119 [Pelodytes ibericus]
MCNEFPQHHTPPTGTCFLFRRDLSMRDLDVLQQISSVEEFHRTVSGILCVGSSVSESRVSVLLDLYYYTMRFCRDSEFSREQTSCLFSIVKETHATCLDTPLGNADVCYKYFKELLLCHAIHRPPYSLKLFTPEQIQCISHYFLNTYFRHFKLYKYVFTPQVQLDLSIVYEESTDTSQQQEPDDWGMRGRD